MASFKAAKSSFQDMMKKLENRPADRQKFVNWLEEYVNEEQDHVNERQAQASCTLDQIRERVRDLIPSTNATFESENISYPTVGEDANMNEGNTIHVDSFLYDEDDEDKLVEEGKLTRSFCRDCGSRNTKEFFFITHSCSQSQMSTIFTRMIPDLEGKVLLDVGSRTGALLYGAFVYSQAKQIIGVEMNKDFCQLQREIIKEFSMGKRVCILEGDVVGMDAVVKKADVVCLNNVFEFFCTPEQQISAWQFLRATVKRGALLVTNPTLEKSLQHLDSGIQIEEWVRAVTEDEEDDWLPSDGRHMSLYQVL